MGVIMEMKYSEEDKYFLAKKKVGDIKGFYGNLASYVFVNAILIFVNLYTSPEYLWFFWPLLWWGIGVVFHGLRVFDVFPVLGKDWEEKKIKEFMEKEKWNKNKWQ
ncbi:histidine kinase [Flavobacterium plurextorum]|uniref:Histidine kinase n=2 Tax=Flavobacterium plurextorum TaxID=1114867 RepID=A0ABX4CZM1_9FLAO|nr:2TM domain-containing protein [Flavobacterium sp. 2]OXB11517.1 histidine kinase [Flavobacterium plurextorum]PIF71672.1 2TM domain-containing protein [Flavobacterium sp. 2]